MVKEDKEFKTTDYALLLVNPVAFPFIRGADGVFVVMFKFNDGRKQENQQ